jgi:hypothetical protein
MDRLPRIVLVMLLLVIGADGIERALTVRSMSALNPPAVTAAMAALLAPPPELPPPPPPPPMPGDRGMP